MAKTLLERLMAKAHPIPFTGCFVWLGEVDKDGYGRISNDGKKIATHRAAYTIFKGPPLAFVCHTCDTPSCINPDHLYDGDNSQNMQDRSARGRAKMAIGEKHGRNKYTEQQVLQIRQMRSEGGSMKKIAKAFATTSGYVSLVVGRKIWKHI